MREAIGRLEFWEIAAVYPAAGRYIAIPLALVIGVGIGVVLLANGAVLPGIIALTILLPVLVGVAHLAIQLPFLAMGALRSGSGGVVGHDLGRRSPPPEQVGHHPHWPVYVPEERYVPGAQVIEPGLAVRRLDKALLGTPAVTGEAHVAFPTVTGQRV